MDRAQELELIERHLAGTGATRLPARRAYQTSHKTQSEADRISRWRSKRLWKQALSAKRAP